MLTADAIFGQRIAPAPWPSARPVLAIAIKLLPRITDEVAIDLIAHLAEAIVDVEDELRAVRTTFSVSLELTHTQQVEISRLRQRLAVLLEERRPARTATA
jgi:hypothetical protein